MIEHDPSAGRSTPAAVQIRKAGVVPDLEDFRGFKNVIALLADNEPG